SGYDARASRAGPGRRRLPFAGEGAARHDRSGRPGRAALPQLLESQTDPGQAPQRIVEVVAVADAQILAGAEVGAGHDQHRPLEPELLEEGLRGDRQVVADESDGTGDGPDVRKDVVGGPDPGFQAGQGLAEGIARPRRAEA